MALWRHSRCVVQCLVRDSFRTSTQGPPMSLTDPKQTLKVFASRRSL
jgi:hypothetical protein